MLNSVLSMFASMLTLLFTINLMQNLQKPFVFESTWNNASNNWSNVQNEEFQKYTSLISPMLSLLGILKCVQNLQKPIFFDNMK